MIAQNTAAQYGGESPVYRWQELVDGDVQIDTRSAEQIITDVCTNAGLEITE